MPGPRLPVTHSPLETALDTIRFNGNFLQSLEDSYGGFKEAARICSPDRLIDGMTGNVAVLDGLRRRAIGENRHRCSILQARYAESLSWLSAEVGDLSSAMWWIDRASQWAQAANWAGITAWCFVARGSMALIFSGDGRRVIVQVRPVLEMPQASPRMKGWATMQVAYGHALTGNRDESDRALDTAMDWLDQPLREDDEVLGQRSVVADGEYAVIRTTCDIYLGYGAQVIPALEPRLESLAEYSLRMATVTRAKLARAYANAGQPDEACRVAWDTLDAAEQIGSQFARSELRRALPVLNQWHGRNDVQEVIHRLGSSTRIN